MYRFQATRCGSEHGRRKSDATSGACWTQTIPPTGLPTAPLLASFISATPSFGWQQEIILGIGGYRFFARAGSNSKSAT